MNEFTIRAGREPVLWQLPFVVLDVDPEGIIRATNGRFELLTGEPAISRSLYDYLDRDSARELRQLLVAEAHSIAPEIPHRLNVLTENGAESRDFFVLSEDENGVWLIERPRRRQGEETDREEVAEELAATRRELSKKNGRLLRALDEIERKLLENETLSRQLLDQNEAVESQSEELLAIMERLHQGQEELLHVNQQLERRSRELQVALNGRNRFYASMSHELRTPVNAVMGYNDLLLAGVYGELNEHQELAVERSQRAVRHLRELIDDVLDISRIEVGKTDVEVDDIHLADLLEDVLSSVKPLLEARGAEVQLVVGRCPEQIRSDPRRLRQILLNLLSNAIRLGEGKPVRVRCDCARGGVLVIEIVDGGPGIPPEDLPSIFDEFTQSSGTHSGETGLGLAISRSLARLLGGNLAAESTVGTGSTFRLSLPV